MASRVGTARKLRRNQTDAERVLWFQLRDRRLRGLKFRRQVPIDNYVVDFCCESAHLIIELDGGQHAERAQADRIRTGALEKQGYLILRFWNNDVLRNIEGVVESIVDTLNPSPPHPDPLPNGEREKRARGGA
jgi:very-short-patch-repair endonuclease